MGHGAAWTVSQDVALTRAWISISTDPLTGTNQDSKSFWTRVHRQYLENSTDMNRTERSVNSRWQLISHNVQKFVGAFKKSSDVVASGEADVDILRAAFEIYSVENPKTPDFKQHECWELLKNISKFNSNIKKKKQDDSGAEASNTSAPMGEFPRMPTDGESSDAFVEDVRPMGHKRAKRDERFNKLVGAISDHLKDNNKHQEDASRKQDTVIELSQQRNNMLNKTFDALVELLRDRPIRNTAPPYSSYASPTIGYRDTAIAFNSEVPPCFDLNSSPQRQVQENRENFQYESSGQVRQPYAFHEENVGVGYTHHNVDSTCVANDSLRFGMSI